MTAPAERMTWSPDVERALVGAVIVADHMGSQFAESARQALAEIDASAFGEDWLGWTWEAMRTIAQRQDVIDLITVEHELHRRGRLESAGGTLALWSLLDGPPESIPSYARIVRETAAQRNHVSRERLLQKQSEILARRLLNDVTKPDADVRAALDEARESLTALTLSERASGAQAFRSLKELLERPELLMPPECTLPRLAWRGRLVVLAGPDKCGKSTLLAHGSSALTRGARFLGGPVKTRTGRVILVGLEEALGDAVRRYHALDPCPDKAKLLEHPSPKLLRELKNLLDAWPADLVIVDSLTEWARTVGEVPKDGDNAGWANVLRPLVALARDHDVAVVVLHHVRRQDGQYRGSSEIAAAADVLLEMSRPKGVGDPVVRHIKGRGRWDVASFDVALRSSRYELVARADLSLDDRIILFVEQNPGCSLGDVRDNVRGRSETIGDKVRALLARGVLVNRGTDEAMKLYAEGA